MLWFLDTSTCNLVPVLQERKVHVDIWLSPDTSWPFILISSSLKLTFPDKNSNARQTKLKFCMRIWKALKVIKKNFLKKFDEPPTYVEIFHFRPILCVLHFLGLFLLWKIQKKKSPFWKFDEMSKIFILIVFDFLGPFRLWKTKKVKKNITFFCEIWQATEICWYLSFCTSFDRFRGFFCLFRFEKPQRLKKNHLFLLEIWRAAETCCNFASWNNFDHF